MSDINLDFIVSNNEINFTVEPNEITFTPSDIQLTINPAFTPVAGGVDGEVQFNSSGNLVGYPTFTFNYTNNTLSVTNLIANASNFTSTVGNIHITGGINGYFLQTDGAGNLNWSAAGGGGNGSPGGSNTQIQFNDSGLFGGNTGFTFNKTNGDVNIPGNLTIVGNFNGSVTNANYANYAGNVVNANQSNITTVGNLTSLTVNGIANINNSTNITGTISIYEGIENVALIGAQTGTYNFDMLDGSIQYSTSNATANLTVNFRGNNTTTANAMIGNGKSITSTFIMTTGANAYGITNIQIDGSNTNIAWAGMTTPIFVSNSSQSFTFTIIKTSTTPTYKVLGSTTRYG